MPPWTSSGWSGEGGGGKDKHQHSQDVLEGGEGGWWTTKWTLVCWDDEVGGAHEMGLSELGMGQKKARISDKYMSSHFHFLRWPEVVFHCKNVPFKRYWRQICLQYLKNHEKFNFGTEGCVKEGSVPKNIDSVCGCTWLMTILIRTTGHLGRQGEDQGAEDKL